MPRSLSYYLIHPLQQWKAGLLDCLPASLRNKLAPVVEPYVLELDEGHQGRLYRNHEGNEKQLGLLDVQESHVDAGLASMLSSRQAPLLLLLPPAWVLQRQITLPAAAQENLGQVIQFEMDRLTPFAADQVYFDYKVEQQLSSDELMPVSIALVPRNKIASWLSLLDGANIRPDKISGAGLWPDANFLPPEARPATDIKRIALKTLPGVIVIVLLVVAMALPLWQKFNIARAMKAKEVPLRKQANEVISIREQLQAEQERHRQLHAAWTQYPPAVDVLKVLTDLLPDDTSLQQMEIKGDQLVLRGNSSQASSLIRLLEESSGFSDVKFMSSVVQQRGKEQFHLSANIVMPFVQILAVDTLDEPVEPDVVSQEPGEPATESAEAPDEAPRQATVPEEAPVAARQDEPKPATEAAAPAVDEAPKVIEIRSGSADSAAGPAASVAEPDRGAASSRPALQSRPVSGASRQNRLISGAGG